MDGTLRKETRFYVFQTIFITNWLSPIFLQSIRRLGLFKIIYFRQPLLLIIIPDTIWVLLWDISLINKIVTLRLTLAATRGTSVASIVFPYHDSIWLNTEMRLVALQSVIISSRPCHVLRPFCVHNNVYEYLYEIWQLITLMREEWTKTMWWVARGGGGIEISMTWQWWTL